MKILKGKSFKKGNFQGDKRKIWVNNSLHFSNSSTDIETVSLLLNLNYCAQISRE